MDGNLERVWQTALTEVRMDDPGIDEEIEAWEAQTPVNRSLQDFYQNYVWAVYNAGFKIEVLDSLWDRLIEALCNFDVEAISANRVAVRAALLEIISNPRKAEAVVDTAIKLARRPQLWERMQRMTSAAFLDEVQEFKGIGPDNRYHVARNLGWNVPTHGGFTRALADNLQTDCDTLMTYIARASGLKLSTTDTVIGLWRRLECHESDQHCIERFRILIGLGA